MKGLILVSFVAVITLAGCGANAPASEPAASAVSESAGASQQETTIRQDSAHVDSEETEQKLSLAVNDMMLAASWEENASVAALLELLEDGDITIEMNGYGGFEQVGELPRRITSNDVRMTAEAGDIVLYSGDSIVLFYGSNTWAYTKLGRIEGLTLGELEDLLKAERVTMTLSVSR